MSLPLLYVDFADSSALIPAQRAGAEFIKSANDPDPFGYVKKIEEQRLTDVELQRLLHAANQPGPLKPDERCAGKTRLQRLENGWVQSRSCP